jgi:hypothetical protein
VVVGADLVAVVMGDSPCVFLLVAAKLIISLLLLVTVLYPFCFLVAMTAV